MCLGIMEGEELESADLKRLCEAVSANDDRATIRRPYDVLGAVGGSAIRTLRMRSGIPVRCRPVRKEAKLGYLSTNPGLLV